jgi:glycosyltransferase involved in cell wall biosynthesis/2-polyprenyl-3-methyl-5-hydroxy-6-metoxy-1,4-benzoquinol methylase
LNVLLVNYGEFDSQSAIHIHHFANELARRGTSCMVAVPTKPETVQLIGEPQFSAASFEQVRAGHCAFPDGRGPDIVHAWTPREIVRQFVESIVVRHGCPYVVHLEDNEEQLAADALGLTVERLKQLSTADLDRMIPLHLSHPHHAQRFMERAAGITAIIDRLLEFKPEYLPGEIIWPSYNEMFQEIPPSNSDLRGRLGIAEETFVVVYPGNVHASNREEVRSLYLAISLLNRRGYRARLVRLGVGHVPLSDREPDASNPHCLELGFRPNKFVAEALSMADALVQPGSANPFNDYRLPSKLPEFLVSGRPVLLPFSNIGRHLEDGVNCLHLRTGKAQEIADALSNLIDNPELRLRIGRAGRDFAKRQFSWARSAGKLHRLYRELVEQHTRMRVAEQIRLDAGTGSNGVPPSSVHSSVEASQARRPEEDRSQPPSDALLDPTALEMVNRLYGGRHQAPLLGYATVRDYCDSMDHMPKLASKNRDLKDVQRPWMMKAVLGAVPRGGKLLEIGAGEPLVADLLRQLGYQVWVVDPYDGSGNGPVEFDTFRKAYPAVHFLRQLFTPELSDVQPQSFDCIYSISVLEHVPFDMLPTLFEGVRRFLKPDGVSIHAIDHVLKGAGAESTLMHLTKLVELCGFEAAELEDLLSRLEADTDTYYLSAEGHNMWRGSTPYDDFPMRVCVSVQTCCPAAKLARRTLGNSSQPATSGKSGTSASAEPVLALPLGYSAVPVLSPPKLAVLLHLYHLEQTSEFQAYLRNIPCPFTLFVSTDTEEKKQHIEQAFLEWTAGSVEVRRMPNRGRDIAPRLVGFRDIYDDHALVLYLHSKKWAYSADIVPWRKFLLDCLLGSRESVAAILEAFKHRADLGIIAARSFPPIRRYMDWGNNFEVCQALAQCMGISISREDPLDFPAGSMFWARSAALRPLLDLNLRLSDFPAEEGQIDATPAHAIERLFFHACAAAGFKWIRAGAAQDIAPPEWPVRIRRPSDFEDLWPATTMGLVRPTRDAPSPTEKVA